MDCLEDLLVRLGHTLRIDRLYTAMEIMEIELESARQFIQRGWLEDARSYVQENARFLKDLRTQVADFEI